MKKIKQNKYFNSMKESLDRLLAESRKSDTYAKYPQWKEQLDYMFANDKTGLVDKYPMWIGKQLDLAAESSSLREPSPRIINWYIDTLKSFHSYIHRIKNKDLNQYKNFDEVMHAISEAKQSEKEKREFADYIKLALQYQNEKTATLVYYRKSPMVAMSRAEHYEASCDLGYASFCVSSKNTSKYFKDYLEQGNAIYFVHFFNIIPGEDDKQFRKAAIQLSEENGHDFDYATVWDIYDNSNSIDDFENWVLTNIEDGESVFNDIRKAVIKDIRTYDYNKFSWDIDKAMDLLDEELPYIDPDLEYENVQIEDTRNKTASADLIYPETTTKYLAVNTKELVYTFENELEEQITSLREDVDVSVVVGVNNGQFYRKYYFYLSFDESGVDGYQIREAIEKISDFEKEVVEPFITSHFDDFFMVKEPLQPRLPGLEERIIKQEIYKALIKII